MSGDRSLDTNLFICQLEALDKRKQAIADGLIREGIETGNACISYQVVQECLNVALGKAEIPLSLSEARAYLDHVLAPLCRAPTSIDLFHKALDVLSRYGYGLYDSLIIAAALRAGCSTLYSENLQDGQRIEGLEIRNPFRAA